MPADLTAYLPLILVALLVLAVVVWVLARSGRKARVIEDESAPPIGRDVLDEGAARAQRNQALIDAPPAAASATATPQATTAAAFAGTGPDILGGLGEIVGAAAGEEAAAATPPPAPAVAAPAAGEGDDLRRIKGVGPKLVTLLNSLGITTFAEIAAWSEADIDRIDTQLGAFAGRIRRDNWIEQAKMLSAGDTAGFEAKFGRL